MAVGLLSDAVAHTQGWAIPIPYIRLRVKMAHTLVLGLYRTHMLVWGVLSKTVR